MKNLIVTIGALALFGGLFLWFAIALFLEFKHNWGKHKQAAYAKKLNQLKVEISKKLADAKTLQALAEKEKGKNSGS